MHTVWTVFTVWFGMLKKKHMLQGRYTPFYNQLFATDKHMLESVHVILASLLEGGGVCVCSNMFMFFENLDVKTLSFCCKICQHIHLLALEIFQFFL